MTFFHLMNVLALTFAPYFISYKYSGLSEYSSIWKCAQAALVYFLSQLGKLLTLATFFPANEMEGQRFDVIPELMKTSVDIIDILGLHIIISYSLAGKSEIRFLAAGLGWAAADSLASRLIPFWVGARAPGFNWKYTQMGLESNFDLVFYLSTAALVWLFSRNDLQMQLRQATMLLLTFAVYHDFFYDLLLHKAGLDAWSLLGVKAVCTLAMSVVTIMIYGSLRSVQQQNSR